MTLTVHIYRNLFDQAQPGILRAYVIQHGQHGSNLLTGRQISDVTNAQTICQTALDRKFQQHVEIEWTGESQ